MSTRSNIRVILKEEDRNRDMKFNTEMFNVKREWGPDQLDGTWDTVNPGGAEALVIYHHWDGYPEGVGATLIKEYNDYNKALNLVLGGDCSSINSGYVPYATRKSEDWDSIKPSAVSKNYPIQEEYDYMFKDGKWFVRGSYNEDLEDWTGLEEYLNKK